MQLVFVDAAELLLVLGHLFEVRWSNREERASIAFDSELLLRASVAWNLLDLRLEIAVLIGAPLIAVEDYPCIIIVQNVLLFVVIGRESDRKVQALLLVENKVRREVRVLLRS